MKNDIIIRTATKTDIESVIRINDMVQKMHAEQFPHHFKYHTDRNEMKCLFDEIIDKENNYIIVAEKLGNEIIGYLWLEVIERPENPIMFSLKKAFVHQVGVEEKKQNKGIGKKLMTKAEEVAKEFGADRVSLESWEFNQNAHVAFEKFGFEKCKSTFWKNI